MAIAGASGFIGQAIAAPLSSAFKVVGLSRSKREAVNGFGEFRQADLFSLRDCEEALKGVDCAIYLVHSMLPSARLVQGNFADLDLLCADNFARAARKAGVRHIVYLGGLVPSSDSISQHLQSRQEVESVLAATGVPVTVLRAGLIVGAQGSSFQMVLRLVDRLPVMVCPKWTQTKMQPIALVDVVKAIGMVVDQEEHFGKVYDLGCAEAVTYRELMEKTAKAAGVKRTFFSVPLLSPGFSRLWVTLTTGAPKELVAPLVQSLSHEMRAEESRQLPSLDPISIDEMLAIGVEESRQLQIRPRAFRRPEQKKKVAHTVRSVQRMSLPETRDAAWATNEYLRWLPHGLNGLIRVERLSDNEISFRVLRRGPVLLRLSMLPHRSEPSRNVLRVTGGLLARETKRGRLEFRQVLDESTLIAAVHEFVPRLPWWIYRVTQAHFHRYVMYRFGRHLRS